MAKPLRVLFKGSGRDAADFSREVEEWEAKGFEVVAFCWRETQCLSALVSQGAFERAGIHEEDGDIIRVVLHEYAVHNEQRDLLLSRVLEVRG